MYDTNTCTCSAPECYRPIAVTNPNIYILSHTIKAKQFFGITVAWIACNIVLPLGGLLPIYETVKEELNPLVKQWANIAINFLPLSRYIVI